MTELFTSLWAQAQGSLNNQFLSGGLVLGGITAFVAYGRRLPTKLWSSFLYHYTVVVDVTSDDPNYRELMVWLNAQPFSKKSRRLNIKQNKDQVLFVPARGNHLFRSGGRWIWLRRYKEGGAGDSSGGPAGNFAPPIEAVQLRIVGRDRAPLVAIFKEAEDMCKEKESDLQSVYTYTGSWDWNARLPRDLSTVFLPDSAADTLDDMKEFMGGLDWYKSRGIPYRRGYLFYGPPGGGKTTSAAAYAAALDIPIYIMNLASFSSDMVLTSAFTRIGANGHFMLLIEDIDTAMPSRQLDKEKKQFSLGTLLNALDGVQSKESMILVMTTNHPEALDPALLRPGRVDKLVEFPMASEQQISAAIQLYYPDRVEEVRAIASGWSRPISVAQVQENLRNIGWKEKDGAKKLGIEGKETELLEEVLPVQIYEDGGDRMPGNSGSVGMQGVPTHWASIRRVG